MKDRQSVALPWTLKRSLTLDSTRLRCTVGLGVVCRRGSRAAAARPVAVEELAALFVSALVAAAQCANIPARALFRCDGDACAQGRDANGAGWQGLVSVLRVLRVLEGTSARTIKRYASRAHSRVRAEVVPLGLEQIGREPLAAVAIVECERCRDRRHGDAVHRGAGHNTSPACACVGQYATRVSTPCNMHAHRRNMQHAARSSEDLYGCFSVFVRLAGGSQCYDYCVCAWGPRGRHHRASARSCP